MLVAIHPELVTEYFEKPCLIETEGKYTRGMVVINWLRYYQYEGKTLVKIVTNLDKKAVIDLLVESATD